MKKVLAIIFIASLLSNCSKIYIQVFETGSTNTKKVDEYFIYETDSVKITYAFWENHGVMSFAIYNKLDKPIYIDWKNSSFIYKSYKLDYWIDETQNKTTSYFGSYWYNGPLIKPGFAVQTGTQISNSNEIKPERVTFIPPKSNFFKSQFYLLPINCYKLSSSHSDSVVPRNDKPKKNTTVYSEDFSIINSPLKFRNFLAFSFSEDSKEFFYVDNEFFLSNVKEMDLRHYYGKSSGIDNQGNSIYQKSPFKQSTFFYIDVPKGCLSK